MRKKIKGLYLVEFEHGIKFGISSDIETRLKHYKNPWDRKVLNVYIYEHAYNKQIERRLRDEFRSNLKGPSIEFVAGVSIEDVINFLRTFDNFIPEGMIKSYIKPKFYMYNIDKAEVPDRLYLGFLINAWGDGR